MSERRESLGGVAIGAIVLWALDSLDCCSDVWAAVCSGARVAVCCGTAIGVSCTPGEELCSGVGFEVGVARPGVRSELGVGACS